MLFKTLIVLATLMVTLVNPKLEGVWTLDEGASQDMEPVLAAVGVPWMVRKLIGAGDVSAHIVMQGEKDVSITMEVGWMSRSRELITDSAERVTSRSWGDETEIHFWEGSTLVSVAKTLDDKGRNRVVTTTRVLEGDSRLRITSRVEVEGQPTIEAFQYFDRQSSSTP